MLQKTARITLLLLGILALIGALGCSGSDSPILPGSNTTLADSGTDYTDSETEREVADGTYSGTLTDSNGDPLAWVELYLDDEIAGWTEEDGSFELYGIEEDTEYNFEARIDDEVVYSTTLNSAIRTAQEFGDNDPDTARGRVFGFVHDQDGPVPHALVVVFNASENFGVDFTDDKGYYNIPDAPAGPGVILGFAPQHHTARDTLMVIPDGEVQKNLFMLKNVDFGLLGGRVITGPPGHFKPVRHAVVGFKPLNAPDDAPPKIAFTNRHGVYMMGKVPLGPAHLKANGVCYNEGNQVRNMHPGRNFVGFHLEAANCGGIEGLVTDPDGAPIPHATVRVIIPNLDGPNLPPKILWNMTGPMGFYRFDPLPPGQYGMDAGKPGYQHWNHQGPVPVFPDQFTVIDITLVPGDNGGGPGDGGPGDGGPGDGGPGDGGPGGGD